MNTYIFMSHNDEGIQEVFTLKAADIRSAIIAANYYPYDGDKDNEWVKKYHGMEREKFAFLHYGLENNNPYEAANYVDGDSNNEDVIIEVRADGKTYLYGTKKLGFVIDEI